MTPPKMTHNLLTWCYLAPCYGVAAAGSACRRPVSPSRRRPEAATRGGTAKVCLNFLYVRTHACRTWRGITRIEELRRAGLNVAISTNNIVNPFTPYGHPDLLRQALIAAMTAHLGNLDQLEWLLELTTVNPARALGLNDYGLAEERRADLVVLDAETPAQAITEQVEKLWVCKDGHIVVRSTRTSEIRPVKQNETWS